MFFPSVFNAIIRLCLRNVPSALAAVLKLKTPKDDPTKSKKWHKMRNFFKSYLRNLVTVRALGAWHECGSYSCSFYCIVKCLNYDSWPMYAYITLLTIDLLEMKKVRAVFQRLCFWVKLKFSNLIWCNKVFLTIKNAVNVFMPRCPDNTEKENFAWIKHM